MQESMGEFTNGIAIKGEKTSQMSEEVSHGQADAQLPTLREILEKNLPTNKGERETEEYPLIDKLPSAFSSVYLWKLLEENGIKEFQFADKNPQEIIDIVLKYCASVQQSERDPVCQRLEALEWTAKINNIRACAMETVNVEIIYAWQIGGREKSLPPIDFLGILIIIKHMM